MILLKYILFSLSSDAQTAQLTLVHVELPVQDNEYNRIDCGRHDCTEDDLCYSYDETLSRLDHKDSYREKLEGKSLYRERHLDGAGASNRPIHAALLQRSHPFSGLLSVYKEPGLHGLSHQQ